ncbi:diacylglycerol kinase family protein [Dactylosporangium vinaceum]|uniref:Diacylglycerol/lipid kinase family protein n=1 Tax=Dactylosporangium vinaceum TaxID=53362 RepID=A0ABV5M706_9ACTN|nr:diacylglycerol kinase family protein [Dactylosporangium vinaceum]
MTVKSAIVINPSKVLDMDERRRELFGAVADAGWPEPLWLETTPEDPGCGMARAAAAEGVEVVLVCGGDGTVMAVAGELAGTDVAVALIPSGTGNLLATNLGIPRDVAESVAVAITGKRRRIDVGEVDGCGIFTVMAGMGFDAAMVGDTPDSAKARFGWAAYVATGLRNLTRRRASVRIRLDGGKWLHRRASTVLVANVGRLQGGLPLLPDAEPDDGCLDVAVLTPRHVGDWLRLAGGVLLRRGNDTHGLETFRAQSVEVQAARDEPRELDGDVIAPARQLTARVRPGALVVCVPAD